MNRSTPKNQHQATEKVDQYAKIPHSIIEHPYLSIMAKCVYMVLAKHYPNICPSITRIQNHLRISKSTTLRALEELEKSMVIEVKKSMGKRNWYRISKKQQEIRRTSVTHDTCRIITGITHDTTPVSPMVLVPVSPMTPKLDKLTKQETSDQVFDCLPDWLKDQI